MGALQLSTGHLDAAVKGGEVTEAVTLKVTGVSKGEKGHWECALTDGSTNCKAILLSQWKKGLDSGKLTLKEGAVVKVESCTFNLVQDQQVLMVVNMELLQQGTGKDAAAAAASDAAGSKPDQQATPAAAKQQPTTPGAQHSTPAGAGIRSLLTPGPTPSPSEEVKGTPAATPATVGRQPAFTPGSTGPRPAAGAAASIAVAERAGVQPIAALNPYQKNWCIKAKVTRKGLMRSFSARGGGGGETKVFDVDLADAMGTQIQGSFWRESADKFYDNLQEDKVYYFSNFTVKPANKQYVTVRNDYQINFDGRTEVEEAKDQSGINTDLPVDLVPFDKLVKQIGRKAPFDIMGMVTSVGTVGSVKRKADNSDVTRREVTLADSSRFSVVLTLWGNNATCGELEEGRVLQVTSVKANDFNGCSLSSLARSKVTLDPDSTEAAELRNWWSSEGSSSDITPLGQSITGGAASAGGVRRNRLELLSAVNPEEPLPPPDAKPTYHDMVVTVAQVYDEKPLTYMANPATGRKVVPQEGRYWCEQDGCFVDAPEHRYMMSVMLADATSQAYVTVFNEQGATLLGCSADEAAAKQENDPEAFKSMIKDLQWSEWNMTLTARTREYNGERTMRRSVQRLKPMDYATEGHRLLQLIQQGQQ